MKVQENAELQLGANWYTVEKWIGRGTVNDVYRAIPRAIGVDVPVAIKVLRDDLGADAALGDSVLAKQIELRVGGMQREEQVLETLNRAESAERRPGMDLAARMEWAERTRGTRRVIALLDAGQTTNGEPYLVTEMAPPQFERFSVNSLDDEFRMLAVAGAIAGVMSLAHSNNMALQDFDPRMHKDDRIRLQWLEDGARFELKIIDWNVTGDAAEHANDLFRFGGHLYYLFVGHHLPVDSKGQPLLDLDTQDRGWTGLTEGTRSIISRLVHRDPGRRYDRAATVEADLAWWRAAVEAALGNQNCGQFLQEQARLERRGRPDRVMAIADLATKCGADATYQSIIDNWAKNARAELEKEIWLPIAGAMESLDAGQFSQAAVLFSDQVRLLSPTTPAARYARVYQRMAQTGEELALTSPNSSVLRSPEWSALVRAAEALTSRKWVEADRGLTLMHQQRPEMSQWTPVKTLSNYARAGLLLEKASGMIRDVEPAIEDVDSTNWLAAEQERIKGFVEAIEVVGQAQKLAPDDPDFAARLDLEQGRLESRRRIYKSYQSIDQTVAQARGLASVEMGNETQALEDAEQAYDSAATKYQLVVAGLESILDEDPTQLRARLIRDRIRPEIVDVNAKLQRVQDKLSLIRQANQAIEQTEQALKIGQYQHAYNTAVQATELRPVDGQGRELEMLAQAGLVLLHNAQKREDEAQQTLLDRDWSPAKVDETKRRIDQIRAMKNVPLVEEEETAQVLTFETYRFRLPNDLSERLDLLERQIELIGVLSVTNAIDDHTKIIEAAESLEKTGIDLTDQESKRYEASCRIVEQHQQAKALIAAGTYHELAPVVAGLADDTSAYGVYVKEVFQGWRKLEQSRQYVVERRLDEATGTLNELATDSVLPESLVKDRERLVQEIFLIREVRNAVRVARAGQEPERFHLVLDNLEKLSIAGLELTLEENGWNDEASGHLQLPVQIEKLLASDDLDTVEKAWTRLENQPHDVANPLGILIAETWLRLVEEKLASLKGENLAFQQESLENIESRVRKHRDALNAFGFDKMRERLSRGITSAVNVVDALILKTEDPERAKWDDLDGDDHPIAAIHDDLQVLVGAGRSFEELSNEWQVLFKKHVEAYATDQMGKVVAFTDKDQPQAALVYLDRYLVTLPKDLIVETWQRCTHKRAELAYWVAILAVYREVERGSITYEAVQKKVDEINRDQDAEVVKETEVANDRANVDQMSSHRSALPAYLQDFLEDLPKAVDCEHLASGRSESTSFLTRMTSLRLTVVRDAPELRVPGLDRLLQDLEDAFESTGVELARELNEMVFDLDLDGRRYDKRFGSLYWQVEGCRRQPEGWLRSPYLKGELEDAANKSVEMLSAWCGKLEKDICHARSKNDLDVFGQATDYGLILYLALWKDPLDLKQMGPERRPIERIQESRQRLIQLKKLTKSLGAAREDADLFKIADIGREVSEVTTGLGGCAAELGLQALKQQQLADELLKTIKMPIEVTTDSGDSEGIIEDGSPELEAESPTEVSEAIDADLSEAADEMAVEEPTDSEHAGSDIADSSLKDETNGSVETLTDD